MSATDSSFLNEKSLCFVLAALFIYHILCMQQPHMGLFYDEAYYAHWSENIAFGYYSKPPVVAWLIALTSHLFGNSDWAIKLGSPVLYTASAWLVYLLGRKLADRQVGVIASLVFISTPIIGFNSLFITTDAPLIFFWVLSSYLFLLCLDKNTWHMWILLGLSIGLGMLSKYTFALLPIGLVIYLVSQSKYAIFANKKAWLGGVVSCLLFALNLYWNSQNEFISFSHTQEIAKFEDKGLKFLSLLEFLFSQILVFGLITFAFFIFLLFKLRRKLTNNSACIYLLCIGLPILILVSCQALFARAFVNWAGPFVIAMSVAAAMLFTRANPRYWASALAFNHVLLILFFHWPIVLDGLGIEESKHNSPYHRLSGWQQLSNKIDSEYFRDEANVPSRLVSVDRNVLAYVGHYAGFTLDNLFYWNENRKNIRNHYDLVNDLGELGEHKAHFVSTSPMSDKVKHTFNRVDYLGQVSYEVSPEIKRAVYVYEVEGFYGYSDT